MKAVPGDPLTQEQSLHKEIYESLRAFYGFDKPLLEQYIDYLKNILTFNMGPSLIHSGRTATAVIREAFPVSAFLGLEALLIASTFGLTAGMFSAILKGRGADNFVQFTTVLMLSIPSFILGAFLQYLLAVRWELLPVARWETLAHTLLPSLALAAMPGAFLAKLVRANMIEVLKQDYILLARAKGLPFWFVMRRHALRNALLPLFGYFGKMSANILVGSFVIEKIFSIPGLGYWFVSSIGSRDYPIIMALTIFYSILLLGALFLADIAHAWMDSRLYRKSEGVMA